MDEVGAAARRADRVDDLLAALGTAARAATALLTAVAGGATLLMATGRIDYMESALSEALNGLRPSVSPAG